MQTKTEQLKNLANQTVTLIGQDSEEIVEVTGNLHLLDEDGSAIFNVMGIGFLPDNVTSIENTTVYVRFED